jgi:hypothetical protein
MSLGESLEQLLPMPEIVSLEELLPMSEITGRVTDGRVARRESLVKSLGESLEELLPISNRPVAKPLCSSQGTDSKMERREIIS